MTVQILGEVLEVFPASVGTEKSYLFGGGSDLNSFVPFHSDLNRGVCARLEKGP